MGMFISFRHSRSMRINVFGVSNIKGCTMITRILLDFLSNSDQIIDYSSATLLVKGLLFSGHYSSQ